VAKTLRNVGDEHEPRAFNTYAAVAFAFIGKLIDTLEPTLLLLAPECNRRLGRQHPQLSDPQIDARGPDLGHVHSR
jgi:hypothetical protein